MEGFGQICQGCVMRRDALALLRAHEADLKRLGVERLYLFGSTAREEATEESDVDLFRSRMGKAVVFPIVGREGIRGEQLVTL
jgi:predicted nucleotidyltransferase